MSRKWIFSKAGEVKIVSNIAEAFYESRKPYGWCYDKAGNYKEVSAPQTAEEITAAYKAGRNK